MYANIIFSKKATLGKRITLKEIAEKANVSMGTVDRVIHNRGEVATPTRDRILKIIEEGNYEPNIFARNLVLNKTYKIASITPRHKVDEYWAEPLKGIKKAEEEFKRLGIEIELFMFDQHKVSSFKNVIKKALDYKPDGILLAPVLHDESVKFTEECQNRNVPFVLIDSDLPESGRFSFIGQDSFQSGFLAGKLMHFSLPGKRRILAVEIVEERDDNFIIRRRFDGFRSFFAQQTIQTDLEMATISYEHATVVNTLYHDLNTLDNINGIFVPNSKAHYVANLLEKYHRKDIILIGYDLTTSNINFLEKDYIDFLINQKPVEQGFIAIKLLYQHLVLKQPAEKRHFIPLDIITKENLAYYQE